MKFLFALFKVFLHVNRARLIWCMALCLSIFFVYYNLHSSNRPYLTVIGPAKMADGIGRQAAELMNALCDELSIGFIPSNKIHYSDLPPKILPLIENPNRTLGHVIVYERTIPTKHTVQKLKKTLKSRKNDRQIRIAYSMVEATQIPPNWTIGLNQFFDAVAVPDAYLKEVYETSGVHIPIFVLPLGLEIDQFLEKPLKISRNASFRFVNASSMIPRKNLEGLVNAFYQAFKNNPDVELKLNFRSGKQETLKAVTNLIQLLDVRNISVTNEQLDKQQYLEFLASGDAFVSLAKGEGFSIQPREAMALGLPVIISDNTAHKTIVSSGLAVAIPCPRLEPSYNFGNEPCGEEFLADIEAAAAAMKEVHENYESHLLKAQARRQWASKYRFENLKPLYLSLVKPKQVILGNKNEVTNEYLMTSSKELYEKYKKLPKQ